MYLTKFIQDFNKQISNIMKNLNLIRFLIIFVSSVMFIQCTSDPIAGADGIDGINGVNGANGADGVDGSAASCIACHAQKPFRANRSGLYGGQSCNRRFMG